MAVGHDCDAVMWSNGAHVISPLFIFSTVFLADRLTKLWALAHLSSDPEPICYGFNLVICWNRGISWSMFATADVFGFWILTAVIIAFVAMCCGYVFYRSMQGLSVIAEAMILGGAVSNLYDRFYYGAVLDFIEWYLGSFYWPVFNVADAMIVCGVGIVMYRLWRKYE